MINHSSWWPTTEYEVKSIDMDRAHALRASIWTFISERGRKDRIKTGKRSFLEWQNILSRSGRTLWIDDERLLLSAFFKFFTVLFQTCEDLHS
jgi:hypothetical protein